MTQDELNEINIIRSLLNNALFAAQSYQFVGAGASLNQAMEGILNLPSKYKKELMKIYNAVSDEVIKQQNNICK